jgi:hypothetical protein
MSRKVRPFQFQAHRRHGHSLRIRGPRGLVPKLPWEGLAFSRFDVDAGDFLLDWRSGGEGLRYIHHFDEPELSQLAASSGFQVVKTYYSDGEGGNLGLYQVWKVIT